MGVKGYYRPEESEAEKVRQSKILMQKSEEQEDMQIDEKTTNMIEKGI